MVAPVNRFTSCWWARRFAWAHKVWNAFDWTKRSVIWLTAASRPLVIGVTRKPAWDGRAFATFCSTSTLARRASATLEATAVWMAGSSASGCTVET